MYIFFLFVFEENVFHFRTIFSFPRVLHFYTSTILHPFLTVLRPPPPCRRSTSSHFLNDGLIANHADDEAQSL